LLGLCLQETLHRRWLEAEKSLAGFVFLAQLAGRDVCRAKFICIDKRFGHISPAFHQRMLKLRISCKSQSLDCSFDHKIFY
jgi:hypothetical protein